MAAAVTTHGSWGGVAWGGWLRSGSSILSPSGGGRRPGSAFILVKEPFHGGGVAWRVAAAAAPPRRFMGASGVRDGVGGLRFLSVTGVLPGAYLRWGVVCLWDLFYLFLFAVVDHS